MYASVHYQLSKHLGRIAAALHEPNVVSDDFCYKVGAMIQQCRSWCLSHASGLYATCDRWQCAMKAKRSAYMQAVHNENIRYLRHYILHTFVRSYLVTHDRDKLVHMSKRIAHFLEKLWVPTLRKAEALADTSRKDGLVILERFVTDITVRFLEKGFHKVLRHYCTIRILRWFRITHRYRDNPTRDYTGLGQRTCTESMY